MIVVSLYVEDVEAYASMRPSFLHEIGSKTMKSDIASQPVLTSYKLLEIERPRFAQQVLEFVYRSDIATPRGLVNALLEAEDMPMDFLPWDGLPGRHQGLLILCFGS